MWVSTGFQGMAENLVMMVTYYYVIPLKKPRITTFSFGHSVNNLVSEAIWPVGLSSPE